jgi:hypothetical protein
MRGQEILKNPVSRCTKLSMYCSMMRYTGGCAMTPPHTGWCAMMPPPAATGAPPWCGAGEAVMDCTRRSLLPTSEA